jgi:Myo-inositol-1-phosphate synthase
VTSAESIGSVNKSPSPVSIGSPRPPLPRSYFYCLCNRSVKSIVKQSIMASRPPGPPIQSPGSIGGSSNKLRPNPRDTGNRSRGSIGSPVAASSTPPTSHMTSIGGSGSTISQGSTSNQTQQSMSNAGIANTSGSSSSSVIHNDAASVAGESIYSAVSVTSTYRHHHSGPFAAPPRVAEPQPVLVKDTKHRPKTHGSLGILIVGLGGANGTTLLAGVLANRLKIHWHGARGEPMKPHYYGCITQIPPRGVHGGVGYQGRVKGLADVSMAAIGGWVSTMHNNLCRACSDLF